MAITNIFEPAWTGILKVQAEAYIDVEPEHLNVLKSKWRVSPDTCFVCADDRNKILGYLLAHPWHCDEPPRLFKELSGQPCGDILYLHDLAVSPHARGMGIGRQLTEKLLSIAKEQQYHKVLLVAVQGAGRFWSTFGFQENNDTPLSSSYGNDAKVMSIELSS